MMKLTSVFAILGLVHEASASSSIATIPVGGGNVVNMIDTGVTFSLKLHGSATAMNNTTSDSASQEAPTSPPHWVDNEPKNATFCFDIHQVQQDNDDIPLPSPTLAPRGEDEVVEVVEQQVETVIVVQVEEEEPQEQCSIDSIKFIEDVVHPARRSLIKKRKTLTKKKRSVVDALSNMQQQRQAPKPSFPPQPVHVQEAPVVLPEESCDGDNIKFIVDVVHTARRTHKKMKQQETVKQVKQEEVQQEQEAPAVVQEEEESSVCDVTNILYITDVVHPARRAHKKKSSSMKVVQQQQQVVQPLPQHESSCDGTNIRFISEVVHPARRTYNKKNKSMEVLLQVPESSSSCDVTNIMFISDVVHPARRTFNRTVDVPQQVTSQPQQEESCDATNIKFITDVVHPARRQHQQRR